MTLVQRQSPGRAPWMCRVALICWLATASLLLAVRFAIADPLPSWNEGSAKQSITTFVTAATNQTGRNYIQPPDRIAVFDNDGTLWTEQPIYFQFMFALDRVKQLAPQHDARIRLRPRVVGGPPRQSARRGECQGLDRSGHETRLARHLRSHKSGHSHTSQKSNRTLTAAFLEC